MCLCMMNKGIYKNEGLSYISNKHRFGKFGYKVSLPTLCYFKIYFVQKHSMLSSYMNYFLNI